MKVSGEFLVRPTLPTVLTAEKSGRGGLPPGIPDSSVAQVLVTTNLEGNISETVH
jgi:hypothetical protein